CDLCGLRLERGDRGRRAGDDLVRGSALAVWVDGRDDEEGPADEDPCAGRGLAWRDRGEERRYARLDTGLVGAVDIVSRDAVGRLLTLRDTSPSPNPKLLHAVLAKSSMRKAVFGVLLSRPVTVTVSPLRTADVRTGKFWKLFGPASVSPVSFGVTSSLPSP